MILKRKMTIFFQVPLQKTDCYYRLLKTCINSKR